MDSALVHPVRRPRRRPPLKSYVPFFIFVACCLVILFALIWLIAHLILLADGGGSASSLKNRLAMEVRSPLPTHMPARPSATSTLLGIGSMMALGSAQPTPTPSSTTAPTRIPSHPSPPPDCKRGEARRRSRRRR